ncbi:Holliday junction resolvase RuvX [Candidatus Phytoplasma melaleucae]|uniref:Putative pre-16S rRNA nuclease n=1 Tax=Candidatus Phytoplasma melaleucae TaxID=2982630 RepID=A0ABT9DE15_9MOLU|nr:Holliday junction resolvase RuvX ['Melaleuca sp.' phytoplasma]MDO8168252.1 Holliday junction resolvase RuvX ['Melaleuca sp.' phytoplasma]
MNDMNNSYLGLDLGEKTLGIAFSRFGLIAHNLKTLTFNKHQYTNLILPLKKTIEELNIKMVILGNPKHMNNCEGIKSKISIMFQKKMQKSFPLIKVILWDERLSTQQAINIMHQKNYNKQKITKLKDEVSAMIILQSFLNYQKHLTF